MTNYKVDIFKILNGISQNDLSLIDTLSEEELKELSPFLLQLWLKGADNNVNGRILLMNELLNPYTFSLSQHKKLLYKLMCVCNGFKIPTRFHISKRKKKTVQKHIKIIMEYYQCSEREAIDYGDIFEKTDIIVIAENMGYDSNEIKDITSNI